MSSATTMPLSYQAVRDRQEPSRWRALVKVIAVIVILSGSASLANSVRFVPRFIQNVPISWFWKAPPAVSNHRYLDLRGQFTTPQSHARQMWFRFLISRMGVLSGLSGGILLLINRKLGRILSFVGLLMNVGFYALESYRVYAIWNHPSIHFQMGYVPDFVTEVVCYFFFAIFACIILTRRGLFVRR